MEDSFFSGKEAFPIRKLKGAIVALSLLTSSFIQPQTPVSGMEQPFRDIGNSYAREAIIRLYDKNILKGTAENLFSPTRPITRAEFLVTMNRILGLEAVDSPIPAYWDVRKGTWYYPDIQAATELGLTEGKGAGKFEPSQPVTRQEAAVMIVRLLNEDRGTSATAGQYKDEALISAWARSSVGAISRLGLMEGSAGRFNPTQPLTRQEIAMILDRLLQNKTWSGKLSAKPDPGIQIGWQYGQTDEQYKQSIQKSEVNVISPRWFFLEENGGLTNVSDSSLVAWAKKNGKQVWAMFGNRLNMENTHTLLSSKEKTTAVIAKIKNQALKQGLKGINLDFENVAPGDKAALTSFVETLAGQLHANDMVLSLDVSPDLGTDWTEAFDYAALGKSADYMVLMGYDEHWSGGASGSVASLPWVQRGLDTLLKKVPASKVILALPLYTRDWTVNESGATVNTEELRLPEQDSRIKASGLRPAWNAALGQYTAEYRSSGAKHRIWLEETRSLTKKYAMALDRNIAGIAYWHIGGETPEIWPALRNAEKYDAVKNQN